MDRIGMTQAMWSFVRYIKSAFLSPPPKSSDYDSWLENAAWSFEEKKNMSIVAIAWYSLNPTFPLRRENGEK